MKKNLYIASGLPGSGKTTYIDTVCWADGGAHISRDSIRFQMLKEGDDYFKYEKQVFEEYVSQIQEALNCAEGPIDVYADATQINRYSRRKLLNALDLSNVGHICILRFSVPLDIIFIRNAMRPAYARVPQDVIKRMAKSLDFPKKGEYSQFPHISIRYIDAHGNVSYQDL